MNKTAKEILTALGSNGSITESDALDAMRVYARNVALAVKEACFNEWGIIGDNVTDVNVEQFIK